MLQYFHALEHLISAESARQYHDHILHSGHPRVPQEREVLLRVLPALRHRLLSLRLIDLVRGEVGRVRPASQVRHEGRIDIADGGPVDAVEELASATVTTGRTPAHGMSFQLLACEPAVGFAQHS